MRKFTLMLLCAFMAVIACSATPNRDEVVFTQAPVAGSAVVEATSRISAEKLAKGEAFTAGRLSAKARAAVASRMKSPKAKAASIDDFTGSRYVITHANSTGVVLAREATVTKVGTDSLVISGFVYSDVTVGAKVDLATGKVTINPQYVATVQGYSVSICSVDLDKNVYSETDPVEGTIENGDLHLETGFGFFVTSGSMKGSYLTVGIQSYADVAKVNGRVTSNQVTFSSSPMSTKNRSVTTLNDWVYVRQTAADKIRITHLTSTKGYFDVDAKLNYDNTISIDPQTLITAAYAGSYSCYGYTETVKDTSITISAKILSAIPGTFTQDGDSARIGLGHWLVGSTSGGILNIFDSSNFSTSASIVFPTKPEANFEGSGTEADPYLIKTAADIKALSVTVNTDATKRGSAKTDIKGDQYYPVYEGTYFALAADINLGEYKESIDPIGTSSIRFAGTLDGRNHTISKLQFIDYAYDYVGLFGATAPEATVKNLRFSQPKITTVGYNVGVLAGRNFGTVDAVTVDTATITCSGYNAGLICGYNYGAISNVKTHKASIYAYGYVGGVAGLSYGNVTSSSVEGATIRLANKQQFAGGLVGYMSRVSGQPNSQLLDCSFSGTVYSSANEICLGGLVGEAAYTEIARCFTAGRILGGSSTSNYLAGLVGAAWVCDIHDCYASGIVENENSVYAAGLVAEDPETSASYGGTKITNCYSAVQLITAATDSIAGLIGKTNYITLSNCYFDTQLANIKHAEYGKTTAELTSAAGISGFDSSVWNFTAGLYPRIKGNDTTDVAVVSASPIILADADNVKLVKSDFTYSTANNVKWRAVKNGYYSEEGGYAFTFNDGVAKLNYQQYTDTLQASRNNASKLYFVNIAPMPFNGEGTAENPWEIGTREELNQLVSISTNATLTFDGKYFKQIANIDMKGDTIKPIDNDNSGKLHFQGTYDGQGYTIDNMVISTAAFYAEGNTSGKTAGEFNPRDNASTYYGGLFGTIGENGVVKNVVIGSGVTCQFFCYGGAIAGQCYGHIENCSNYGTVYTYYSRSGGIVGQLNKGGVVSGCYNAGNVYVDNNQAGGIAGYAAQATIENCQNAGEVGAIYFNSYQKEGAQTKAGGIVGEDSKCTISNVLNTGRVVTYKQVGGISGVTASSTISNAVNYGTVVVYTDKATSGHIAGANTSTKFSNSYYANQIAKLGAVANGNIDGVEGKTTTALAAGDIKTLPDSIWKQTAGSYPVIAAFADKAEAKLAAEATVFFADGNFASSVLAPATLGNTKTVTWSLKSGKAFSIADATLTPTIPASGAATDTLVAVQGSLQRTLPLVTLNAAVLDGKGTAEAPYLIKNLTDYNTLADFIETTGFDYESNYFKVVNDIDFKDATFKPLAYDANGFAGDFDGNGKTFSGISYNASTDKTSTGYALFGTVLSAGSVHDLTIDATSDFGSYTYAAPFVSSLYGKVYNLTNKATVTAGNNYAGGIVAKANAGASIKNCYNTGDVTGKYGYVGGIFAVSVAGANVTVDSCINEGVITGTNYVGGIAAQASVKANACVNRGSLISSANYVGGVAGQALAPSGASYCHNEADLLGVQYVGGIFGQSGIHTEDNRCVIDSCYNIGSIQAATSSKKKSYYLGGIVGASQRATTISRCYNTGDIKPESDDVALYTAAGIAGSSTSASSGYGYITDCWNNAAITAFNNVGGIGGSVTGDTTSIITRCYNLGEITSTSTAAANAGGIVGTGGYELSDSYNAGTITGAGYQIGGVAGYLSGHPYDFHNVANYGTVTGTSAKATKVGGIVGMGRVEMHDCYNFGEITGYDNVAGIVGYPGNALAETYYTHIAKSYNAGKVTATNGSANNITCQNTSCNYYSCDSVYFDSSVNEAGTYDTANGVKGLDKRELVDLKISDAFENAPATYPSLKVFANNDYNSFAVAMLLLAEGEKTDSVIHDFQVGTPNGAVWTASDNLAIDGNNVKLAHKTNGEAASITLTVGNLSRIYNLTLFYPSGVESNIADKAVVSRTYYNLSGVRVEGPSTYNPVVIERTVYTDGTSVSAKVLYRAK